MNGKSLWISIVAIVISFVGGFILANALNRAELDTLRAENGRLKKNSATGTASGAAEDTLSDEEIRRKIADADQNQSDFNHQKTLGLALYRYAAMKQNAELLAEIEKILRRANALDEKDADVVLALGHLNFDIGYFKKDNARLIKAREYYDQTLAQQPQNADVRADYGLTFYLENPPDNARAVAEFNRALAANPKHQKALEFLTQALLKQNKSAEAERTLARLREINPNAPALAEYQAQIARENQ